MKSDLDWMGQRKLSRRANGGNKIGMIFLWPKNVYERLKLVAAEQWPYNLANSVIRLGYFWKFLAINFLTKETSYLATFWAFLKTSLVSINCVGLAAFWVIFGNIGLLLIPIPGHTDPGDPNQITESTATACDTWDVRGQMLENYFWNLALDPSTLTYAHQCDQKKSPKVYKSCPKMISLEKLEILTLLTFA